MEFINQPINPINLLFLGINLIAYTSGLGLFLLLIDRLKILIPVFALLSIPTILIYPGQLISLLLSGIFFCGLIFAAFQVKNTKNLILKINILQNFSPPIRTLYTIFALVLSGMYFINSSNSNETFEFKIPDKIFNLAVSNLSSLVDNNLIKESGSVSMVDLVEEDFTRQLPEIRQGLINQGITDPDEQNKEISKIKAQYESEVLRQIGEAAAPIDPLKDPGMLAEIRESVNRQINSIINQYHAYLPIILSSSFFFTFEFFSIIVVSISLMFISLFFFILKSFDFIRIEKISKEAETIII